MSGKKTDLKRRNFLKTIGVGAAGTGLAGCDLPTTVTLEEGKEDVVAYVAPEEYVIPGIGVWYASTCLQCPAACGVHGRVREGRALKIEGNPDAALNAGKTCLMGQASLQIHYNPNRVRQPMLRKGGKLEEVDWKTALAELHKRVGEVPENGMAWLTGTVSGHQAKLIQKVSAATNSNRHFVHEVVATPVWHAVARDMLGDENPLLAISEAKSILTFGADFLGTWQSPVHFATEYAKFRRGERGVMFAVESKMSITGANADLWLAAKPGSEAVVALGIAHALGGQDNTALPENVRAQIKQMTPEKAESISGVSKARIELIAKNLKERSPSLVLAGAPVEGQVNGYQAVAAVMMLNVILGNIGKTVITRGDFPSGLLMAKKGGTKALSEFVAAANSGQIKVAMIHGANPAYTAPAAMNLKGAMQKVPFKVQFAVNRDETSEMADLVLPIHSAIEDWGTHVGVYQGKQVSLGIQQPMMEPIFNSRGFGDLLIGLLKAKKDASVAAVADYYAYLRKDVASDTSLGKPAGVNEQDFWVSVLQKGAIAVSVASKSTKPDFSKVTLQGLEDAGKASGLTLIPSPRLGLWDGRHANVPWLQEAPDQINKVVWDSWAEIHPETASSKGINHGDMLEVKSGSSRIIVKAFLFKGIHPDAIAVPLGQGHEAGFGQFAAGIGANPLQILDPAQVEKTTGQWAMYSQKVEVTRSSGGDPMLVRMGAVDTQRGRKIAGVISADQYRRSEGGKS